MPSKKHQNAPSIPSSTQTTVSKPTSSSSSKTSSNDPSAILQSLWDAYTTKTPQRIKLLDTFLVFLVASGAIQFVYCVLAGNYPFNAFLSGFSATVGQFVLTASLRIQTNPANTLEFKGTSPERAFADYIFGSLLLHFFCVNFIN
ncbi:MAG: oligosaccharyltransferase complex subunit epsilon [Vezdaea aestivalis]|nr:MAG: oligosaccharyltransferase complex subunit epsilon [Vezdaea aestivalis]